MRMYHHLWTDVDRSRLARSGGGESSAAIMLRFAQRPLRTDGPGPGGGRRGSGSPLSGSKSSLSASASSCGRPT